jgi:phosphatidylserine/phosphatidylglycerophosphate/cardiolipin synthase-like enzyme/subtilisin family serine protease
MGPDLWELFEYGEADDEVAAIIRLGHYAAVPAGVRVVAQFEDIVTVRLSRRDIPKISGSPEVSGMSAGDTYLGPDLELETGEATTDLPPASAVPTDTRRPEGLGMTGRGIVVGSVDWGFDFAHPDFLKPDGTTRILALWDQRGGKRADSPKPFGYGIVHTRDDINRALREKDPYAALKYHPADADTGAGCHGTHVLSIAAGGGGGERPTGIAPEADLVVVHSAPWDGLESGKLGDSVTLLEGIEFISRMASGRPWVINLSMGRHGEQHDGSTLVELGLDAAVRSSPGRAVVLSTGNYFNKRIHASGQLRPTEERKFAWVINEGTPSDYNQLEIWYSWQDKFEVTVSSPDGSISAQARLGEKVKLLSGGKEIGNLYHRAQEPNTLDHHITLFLYKSAPPGEWDINLRGTDVIHGDYHAWIEREVSCPACQSHFSEKDADSHSTTGTICNGRRTLAVGAYNRHDPQRRLGPFSSVGPTRDGRLKPDLCAPGVYVLAARSAPRTGNVPRLTRMSGTSMAAPHVTGTVALMFQAAVKPLRIEETHNLLLGNAERVSIPEDDTDRIGIGFLDVERAVEAAAGADRSEKTFKPVAAQTSPAKAKAESGERVNAEALGVLSTVRRIDESESVRTTHPSATAIEGESEEVPAPSVAGVATRPLLRIGSTGPFVREAQARLNAYHAAEVLARRRGLASGPIAVDGIFGPNTLAAVRSFQQQVFPGQAAAVDGVIGPLTWSRLELVPVAPPAPDPVPPGPQPLPAVAFETSPAHWFLGAAEISAACGGAEPGRRLSAFTSQNLVQPLIDGEEYMLALHTDLNAAATGDFFHLTAWRLNITQDLVPTAGIASTPSRFDVLLQTLARRGVTVRALIFKAVASGFSISSITSQIRENTQARDWYNRVGGRGVIDGRYPAAGSHHQKSAIVQRGGEAVAYCGGLDIAPDRWDTQRHDSDPRRTPEGYVGWHDVHVRVRGPAVLDIEANFRDRWNARREQPSILPPEGLPPVISTPAPPVASAPGTHHVQVLRTFACAHKHYEDFAPAGELTCLAGYLKAIGRAQNYIYIEDQYLVSIELARALDRALDTIQRLVILVPQVADAPPVEAFNFHQSLFLTIVRSRHAGKVFIYHPLQPSTGQAIYVHSKVMVIDDVYAVTGSPNVNRRSMTHDTELATAVVDADLVGGVCRYARDLRLRLWGEHLSLPVTDPKIADPIIGVAEWERQASLATLRVRRHVTPLPQNERSTVWDNACDPDGRCPIRSVAGGPSGGAVAGEAEYARATEAGRADELAELADALVIEQGSRSDSAPVLYGWLERQGLAEALTLPGASRPLTMAEIFDAMVYAPLQPAALKVAEYFDLVAVPQSMLESPLRANDVLLRRGPGEYAHMALLSTSEPRSYDDVITAGGRPERFLPGHYVHVIEGGDAPHTREHAFARRVLDEHGRIPMDTAILRPKWSGESAERLDPLSLVLGAGLASGLSRQPPAAAPATAQPIPPTPDPGEVESAGTLPDLSAWADLLSFRPSLTVQASVRGRVSGSSDWKGWPFQTLEEKAHGPLNLDYYPVVVRSLPKAGGRSMSAAELLEYLRLNLNAFVDNDIAYFLPTDSREATRWGSGSPLGAIVHIEMRSRVGPVRLNPDDGSVACSETGPDHWTFSTIWTPRDHYHPVSGNRMFGFTTEGNTAIFFTRGADRPAGLLDDLAQGEVFGQAHKLWTSLQLRLAAFVNASGGSASAGTPFSERHDWSAAKAAYYRPGRNWL